MGNTSCTDSIRGLHACVYRTSLRDSSVRPHPNSTRLAIIQFIDLSKTPVHASFPRCSLLIPLQILNAILFFLPRPFSSPCRHQTSLVEVSHNILPPFSFFTFLSSYIYIYKVDGLYDNLFYFSIFLTSFHRKRLGTLTVW